MAARLTAILVVVIVSATLIAGLLVGAQKDDNQPVDLLVYNGKVFTGDPQGGFAEAIAVRGNKIVRVGTNRELKRLRRPQTTVIDAHGGAVVPGFNDSHVHFVGGGLALDQIDLLEATTVEQIEGAIRAYAEAHPEKPWIVGRGWYYQPFPGGLPTRQILDALVPDRPAYLDNADGHTAWVNTKALEAAGITRRTPNPPNGIIVKDPRTGEPTGVLKEAASGLVEKLLPEPTREDRLQALRAAMQEAHRFGVTSVQNASGTLAEFELYDELRKANELKVRVYSAVSVGKPLTDAEADALDAIRQRFPDDPLFKTGAIKMMVDGVIEAHTAAMLAPYSNKPGVRGSPMWTATDLDRTVALLDRRGWQILIHAIGDGGIRMSLDAYEKAAAANPSPARGRRHRIEHVETTDPADIPRFGALGVIASMQPFHANPRPAQIDVWAANIGPERAARGWAYNSIVKAGGRITFGSDWPVVTLDPRLGLNMAVNRTTPDGTPEGGWYPDEKLPLATALAAYTSGAAWASFDEHRKGRIAPDMLADMVILSTDIFAHPPERLVDAVVTTTIFDGRIVYSREES